MAGMKSTRSASWVALHIVLLLAIALPLFLIAVRTRAAYALASLWLMPSTAALAMAVTCFVLQYQRMIPGLAAHWRQPSWFENPLAVHQPLQWSLLAGEALMLSGIGCAIVDTLAVPHHCSWELPIAAGVGVWLGTYLCSELWVRRSRR